MGNKTLANTFKDKIRSMVKLDLKEWISLGHHGAVEWPISDKKMGC